MAAIRILLRVLGGLAGLVALLFAGMASLGYLGILADVGEQENQQIGQQALWIALGAGGVSIVLFVLARLLHRRTCEAHGPHGHFMSAAIPYAGYAPNPPKPPAAPRVE